MESCLILKRFLLMPSKLGRFGMRKARGIPVYRKLARLFCSNVEIKDANEEELKEFHAWLVPNRKFVPTERNPYATDMVAKKGSKIVGFVQLLEHPEDGQLYEGYWLFSLVVMNAYRGMGIGEKLSKAVIERARENGAEEIRLLVNENNHKAIDLYRKLGFEIKRISVLEKELEKEKAVHGYRRLAMSKSLLRIRD